MNPDRRSYPVPAGLDKLTVAFLLLLLAVYVAVVTLVPIRADNDVWWHVKSGQYIAQNGIPKNDVMNYMAEDMPWHNHEWLSQVILYGSHVFGERYLGDGFLGVVGFVGIVVYITILVLFFYAARLSGSVWIAFLVCILVVAVGRRMFYPRPPVISNLLLAIEIVLLTGVARGWFDKRWIFALPPMIALWTNLHGAWMAGGVLLAFWAIEQATAKFSEGKKELPLEHPKVVLSWPMLGAVLIASLLATFCNPYGYHLYALPGRVLADLELVRSIGELRSPDFYFVIDFEFVVLWTLLAALFLPRFRAGIFEVGIYIFFLHQAIQHVRHLSLFSIMMVPLLARLIGAVVAWKYDYAPRWAKVVAITPLILGILIGGWVVKNPREGKSYTARFSEFRSGISYERDRFPARVADFILLADLQGRMFNGNNYAGYLIWRLSPESHKVFSDSRFDIFGGELLRLENAVSNANPVAYRHLDHKGRETVVPSWREIVDGNAIQWLIVRAGSGLEWALSESDGDFVAVALWPDGFQIWIRNSDENQAMIARAKDSARLAGATTP